MLRKNGRPRGLWIGLAFLAPLAAYGDPAADGTVTLPLADYLQLVERIDRAEQAEGVPAEPEVAVLTSEATSLTVLDRSAEVRTTYDVELRGRPTAPVLLPVTGLAQSASVEPAAGAALHRAAEGLLFVADRPGRYQVVLRALAELDRDGGISRLKLAESRAPVATLELDLPADQSWSCSHTVVVEESLSGDRRKLRLAPERGLRPVLEVQRQVTGSLADEARARAVIVSVVRPDEGSVVRHDLVLYEVQRGEVGRFVVAVPASLEVARASTDEGSALPWIEGGRLTVERRRRLSGNGHLVVSFRPVALDAGGEVPVPPVAPEVPVRARYLVLASDRAADVTPLPRGAWSRVDVEDLPRTLRPQIDAIAPNAVWRLSDEAAEPRLRAAILETVDPLGTVVWRRSTTTLWTVDGTLVHRDQFTLRRPGASFDVTLPAGATLWSVQVDGQAVRPLKRGETITVPLVFKAEGETEVEVVAVEEQAIVRGTSRLGLELARVSPPVLEQEWLLLLPEQHRYRVAASDLQRAPRVLNPGATRYGHVLNVGTPGRSGVAGTVKGVDGEALPAVTVRVELPGGTSRSAATDWRGHFAFLDLAAGAYRVVAELEGFVAEVRQVDVAAGKTAQLGMTLRIAEVTEELLVTSQSTAFEYQATNTYRQELERRQAQREMLALQQGLAGGVKPLEVEIPESGKLLRLAGALPPAIVGVELELRKKR